MFSSSTPSGSPLSGGWLSAPPAPMAPSSPFSPEDLTRPTAMSPAASLVAQLPKAPPRKKPTIWDGEHISETLAGIGAGFFAGQNFGDGLGAAAQTIAGRTRQLREEQRPDISYGGPGDQVEITTDRRTGQRTYREVPEFRAATDRAAALKSGPDFKTARDMRSRALFTIATQVPPDQRAAAYRDLIANPERFGVDTTGMPAEWDERYGTMAGTMGLSVNEGLNQKRNDANLEDTMRHRRVQEGQANQRVEQGNERVRQGAAKVQQAAQRLRTPPASARKPKLSSANSDLSYLFK
jgi:hypothetical protein